jgi:hypothetical protein
VPEPIEAAAQAELESSPLACAACVAAFAPGERRWECPRCKGEYCDLCNAYMHAVLNNCPTCDVAGFLAPPGAEPETAPAVMLSADVGS